MPRAPAPHGSGVRSGHVANGGRGRRSGLRSSRTADLTYQAELPAEQPESSSVVRGLSTDSRSAGQRPSGFDQVQEIVIEYSDELSFDQLMGGIYSAIPADKLPESKSRPAFAEYVQQSLPAGQSSFTEQVKVSVVVGRVG